VDINSLSIMAPGLIEQRWTEGEALGSAAWLWMHSASHRNFPLHTLSTLLLPAIKNRQFIIASQQGQPVFYLSWANLSTEAEERYISKHPLLMPEADWNSGERMWLLDFIAPFGHSLAMYRLLRRQLFANRRMRFLDHRGDERGLIIRTFRGLAVMREEVNAWLAAYPVMYDRQTGSEGLTKNTVKSKAVLPGYF